MTGLPLIATYALSCGAVLFVIDRFLSPLSVRLGLALAMLPLVLCGPAVWRGDFYGPLNISFETPPLLASRPQLGRRSFNDGILSDVAIQMVPWRKAVRESLKHGQLPLWNRFSLSGGVLLGAAQPAPFNPITLLSCVLPLATAWTFSCAFTFFFAAVFGFVFLRDLELSEPVAFFGAATWMLSNFLVFYIGWPHAAVFAILPLLCSGLYRLASRAARGFAMTLCACALLALGGHPESMLHVVSAAALLFMLELIRRRRSSWLPVSKFLAAGLLAFMLTAPVLLPFLQVARESVDHDFRATYWAHVTKSRPIGGALTLASAAAYPNEFGPVWSPHGDQPQDFLDTSGAFIGGGALVLAFLGMFSRRRQKWAFAIAGMMGLSVASGFPLVTDIVSRLPLFDLALNSRLSAIAAFCLSILAAFGLEEYLARPRGRNRLILALGSIGLGVGGLALRHFDLYRVSASELARSLILLSLPGLLLGVLGFRSLGTRIARPAFALAILLTLHLMELAPLYPAFPARLFYPPIPETSHLPKDEDPYRVTASGMNMVPNQSAMWELEDPRGYEGLTNGRYAATYPLWCTPQPVWFNRVDDLTKPFLSFLNVRYAIGGPTDPLPRGWREIIRGKNCAIFENPLALPRAFIPKEIQFVKSPQDAVSRLRQQAEFGNTAMVEDSRRAPERVLNGAGSVTVRPHQSGLDLVVSANRPSWVVVSNTAWTGWNVTENGERLPLHYANASFLSFEVGPGIHRLSLRYWPTGFTAGLYLMGLSILLLAILRRINR